MENRIIVIENIPASNGVGKLKQSKIEQVEARKG